MGKSLLFKSHQAVQPRQITDQKYCCFRGSIPQRSSPGAKHGYIPAFTHYLGLIYNSALIFVRLSPPLFFNHTHQSALTFPTSIMHTFFTRSECLMDLVLTVMFLSPPFSHFKRGQYLFLLLPTSAFHLQFLKSLEPRTMQNSQMFSD